MSAILKSLHCPNLVDLDHDVPADREHFGLLFQAGIGPGDSEGEEMFSFMVCTPGWLKHRIESSPHGGMFVRHYLVVTRYDIHVIRDLVCRRCRVAPGPTWKEQSEYLGRYMLSEFEGYSGS